MTTKLTAFFAFDRWNSVATSKFLFFDFGESSMVTFSMPLVTLLIEAPPFCLCCVPPFGFRPRFAFSLSRSESQILETKPFECCCALDTSSSGLGPANGLISASGPCGKAKIILFIRFDCRS